MSCGNNLPLLSIVVHIYNEQENLPELCRRVTRTMEELELEYELILVNDGSSDRSLEIIRAEHTANPRVKYLNLSRNFGHQIALTAGIDHAQGDAVVLMDGDLQDPPEVIPDLIARWQEGYDVVYAQREARQGETFHRLLLTKLFYRSMQHLTDLHIPFDAGHFRLLSRRVVESLRALPERNRFIPGLTMWVGFRQTSITYSRQWRFAGETKMSLGRLFRLAFDCITAFSFAPLRWATYLGFLTAGLGLAYTGYVFYVKLFTDIPPFGWSSTIVAVLVLGGVQLITLGILGEYIGRIFEEVKQRPLYFVEDRSGFVQNGSLPTLSIKSDGPVSSRQRVGSQKKYHES